MKALMRSAALALLVASPAVAAAAPPVDWTAVIGPLDDGCYGSRPLAAIASHLYEVARARRRLPETFVLPGLPAAVTATALADGEEAYSAQAAMPGTYAGLPMFGMVFELGKDNGISAFAIYFNADEATVAKRFAPLVAASKASGDEFAATLVVARTNIGVALICDQSN